MEDLTEQEAEILEAAKQQYPSMAAGDVHEWRFQVHPDTNLGNLFSMHVFEGYMDYQEMSDLMHKFGIARKYMHARGGREVSHGGSTHVVVDTSLDTELKPEIQATIPEAALDALLEMTEGNPALDRVRKIVEGVKSGEYKIMKAN